MLVMRRKVIKQRDSYTVTLPIKWVKAHGVDKTAEIDIEEQNSNLVIETESKPQKKEAEINLDSDYALFIRYIITNAYRAGYDVLKLNLKNKEQIKVIQEIIDKSLMGFEITQIKENSCVIESISEPSEEKSDVILRRVFLIIKASLGSISGYINNHAKIDINELDKNTIKVDQYSYFCRRNISKTHYSEKSYFQWMIYSYLVLIQHSASRMASSILENKKPSKHFGKIFSEAFSMFNNFYEGYFEKDLKKLAVIDSKGEELLYQRVYPLFNNNKDGVALYHLAELIRLVYITTSPTIGSFIEYNPKKQAK